MADPPQDPVVERHTRPRWVKAGMILGVLALLLVILSLTGVPPWDARQEHDLVTQATTEVRQR